MCQSVYRQYTKCKCELFAYLWKCEHGPRSPLCIEREYGVIVKSGKMCKYHDFILNRRPRGSDTLSRRQRVNDRLFQVNWNHIRMRDEGVPTHPRDRNTTRSSEDDKAWVRGEPDIDLHGIKWVYARRGRIATAERTSCLMSGLDYDPLASSGSECDGERQCHGCSNCMPYDQPLRRRTYGEGYNSDSWEDLYHSCHVNGNDSSAEEAEERKDKKQGEVRPRTEEENLIGLGRRTVAKARQQREVRERARLGDDLYERRQRLAAQRRRADRARADFVDAFVEHQRDVNDLQEALRRRQEANETEPEIIQELSDEVDSTHKEDASNEEELDKN